MKTDVPCRFKFFQFSILLQLQNIEYPTGAGGMQPYRQNILSVGPFLCDIPVHSFLFFIHFRTFMIWQKT